MYFGWFFTGSCWVSFSEDDPSTAFKASSFIPSSNSSCVLFVGVTSPGFRLEELANIVFSARHLFLPGGGGDSERELLGSMSGSDPWLLYADGWREVVVGIILSKQTKNEEAGW